MDYEKLADEVETMLHEHIVADPLTVWPKVERALRAAAALEKALVELVATKDMKDAGGYPNWEYRERRDAAWKAARVALTT